MNKKELNNVSGGALSTEYTTVNKTEEYNADKAQIADATFAEGFSSGGGIVLLDGSRRIEESGSSVSADMYNRHKHVR